MTSVDFKKGVAGIVCSGKDGSVKSRPSRLAAVAVGVIALLVLAPAASASVEQEEQTGAKLLNELEAGGVRCVDLRGGDFDHVGEYVMGRMMGSPRAHEAMDQMMSSMMGAGERQMHEAMGRRFSGCGGGRLPAGFGRMMGAVNAMGMMGGGMMGGSGARGWNGSGGMMGGSGWVGGMMGGSWFGEEDDSSETPWGAMVAAFVALLIITLAFAWFAWRRPDSTAPESPAEILGRRYASGELSAEEYRARLDALG